MASWVSFILILTIVARNCYVAQSHADRTLDSLSFERESVVCWDGPGRYLTQEINEAGSNRTWEEYSIRISGDGCKKCIAGLSCGFQLSFASDVYFDKWLPGTREFMVILTGPVLVHGSVSSSWNFRRKGSTFDVSYQTWDAGKYILTIDCDCCREEVTGGTISRRLVLLEVEVVEPDDSEKVTIPTPCEVGQVGRWVDTRYLSNQTFPSRRHLLDLKTNYRAKGIAPPLSRPYLQFQPYECVGQLQSLASFAGILLEKGIREISIVGDSHQRATFTHLQTLVHGYFTGDFHGNREFSVFDPRSGNSLQLRFYWMEGIFVDGEYGCRRSSRKGDPDWPVFSNTSDIVILGTAAWTFRLCSNPVESYSQYLPQFMKWNMNLPHKKTTRFFWRTAPPFPSRWYGCSGYVGFRRSSLFAEANRIARSYAHALGMTVMDFWHIEAPRYGDACLREFAPGIWREDSHYSCLYANNTAVYGVVGEYVTRVFVHMLVNL